MGSRNRNKEIADFARKMDAVFNSHPTVKGQKSLAKACKVSTTTVNSWVNGEIKGDTTYVSGQLSEDQIKLLIESIGIKRETILETDFDLFKDEWEKEVEIMNSNYKLLSRGVYPAISPSEDDRWKLFLSKTYYSKKIDIMLVESSYSESQKGLKFNKEKPESTPPILRLGIDEIYIKIECPLGWFLSVAVYSSDFGWESVPPNFQPDSPTTKPSITIPDNSNPMGVTGSGVQYFVAIASEVTLPEKILNKIVDDYTIKDAMSELLLYMNTQDEEKIHFMVKRFEVIG